MAWTVDEWRVSKDEAVLKFTSSLVEGETHVFTVPFPYTYASFHALRSGASDFTITLAYSPTDTANYLTLQSITQAAPSGTWAGNSNAASQFSASRTLRLTGTTLNSQTITLYVNAKNAFYRA